MRKNRLAILCVVLLVSFVNLSTTRAAKKITYTGRVIDYNALPVADATVVCSQKFVQCQRDYGKPEHCWGVRSLPWLILTNPQHIVRAEDFRLSELDEKINSITQK
jgi:hypothetical protein